MEKEISRLNRVLEGLYFRDKSSITFEILSVKDVEEASKLFANVFVTREVLASCLNITIPDMIPVSKALCYLCAMESLSWVARVNGEIVGICLCDMLQKNAERNESTELLTRAMQRCPRISPVFEFLDHIDKRMLQDMDKIDENHRTLHIIAAAVREEFGGHSISTMLAYKSIRHAQLKRKIEFVAQEATGAASQYILRRSLGDSPCVSCIIKYDKPFQNAPCEHCVGRVDRIEKINTPEHTFKVASIFVSFYRSEIMKVLSQSQSLRLYAMYQQAMRGDATDDRAPSMTQIVKRAKFNEWKALRGMCQRNAMMEFVKIVSKAQPYFRDIIEHPKHRLELKKKEESFFIYSSGQASDVQQEDLLANQLVCLLPSTALKGNKIKGKNLIESIMKTDMARTSSEARELANVLLGTCKMFKEEEEKQDDDESIPTNTSSFSLNMTYRFFPDDEKEEEGVVVDNNTFLKSPSKKHWIPDKFKLNCMSCNCLFTLTRRRHHCRLCGAVVCHRCSSKTRKIFTSEPPVRVCETCSSLDDDSVNSYLDIIRHI